MAARVVQHRHGGHFGRNPLLSADRRGKVSRTAPHPAQKGYRAGEDGRLGSNRDELGRTLDRPANRARRRQGQLCGALLLRGQGWSDFQPLATMYPAALWNASGAAVDWEMLESLRAKERYDWRTVVPFHNKEDAYHEPPWFCYLKGENPDYPVQILQAALSQVYRRMELLPATRATPAITTSTGGNS